MDMRPLTFKGIDWHLLSYSIDHIQSVRIDPKHNYSVPHK